MKKFKLQLLNLLIAVTNLFYKLWNFQKLRKLDEMKRRIDQVVADRDVDRIILKSKIVKYMREYLGVGVVSKYIPKRYKNKAEARHQVILKFGPQMKEVDLYINDDLELCTL